MVNSLEKTNNITKQEESSKDKIIPDYTIMNSRLAMAETLWNTYPYFFDKNKTFWFWNKEKSCYVMVDDTDLLNQVNQSFGYNTIPSSTKAEILEALRQTGRKHIPKPISKWWIQFKNQIIDIDKDDIFDASPEYFFTTSIPWEIGDTEETSKITSYIKEWVVKDTVQDDSYVKTMEEVLAYCCLNNQFLQTIFALTGSGSNGKGTFRDILRKFIGKENYCSSEMKLLTGNRFETSSIYRKSVCVVPEVDSYDMQNTSRLKQLTGEDPLRFEFKGKTSFTEESSTKIVVLTNSLPITNDKSTGFYRRWMVIDFPHIFPVGKDILADIPDIEFNNLAKKSIRLLRELKERKEFTNGGNFEERKSRYEERSNPVEKFITECCDLEDPLVPIPTKEFYKEVNTYLIKKGLREQKNKHIKKALFDMDIEVGRRSTRDDTGIHTLSGVWVSWKKDIQISL